ncbi:MAG: ABC transporter permease [Myxococcota bacterium]|nr:ABC transporter permease [Myxococcota bacterium]
MTTEYENQVEEEEDLSFGDIVWGQFKKNRVAYASLWFLGFLFLLAICTPIFASGRPFVWTEGGETSYPWMVALFDRNYYENGVDIFFNLLLVIGIPLFGLFLLRMNMLGKANMSKRPRRKKLLVEGGGLIALFFVVFIGVLLKPYQKPYVQYHDKYTEYELSLQADAVKQAFVQKKEDATKLSDEQKDMISTMQRLSLEPKDLAQGEPISAVFAPVPYAFRKTGFKSLEGPSLKHPIGVDTAGRDVAVQMLYGIRISLSIGVIAVGIYVTIGIIIGAFAGYFAGVIDLVVQRVIEIFMSVPVLIVLLVLIAFIEKPSIYHIMLVIGLFRWTGVARLVRGEFYRLRNLDFVTSAVALGYKPPRIIFQHILPNALGPVLVAATFGVAGAILTESGLSFLGLGDVSVPSWGQTLSDGYKNDALHLILAPGFAIFATVSILNLVGEGLRDALDPKMRK